jgi:hypothetical protein
VVIDRWKVKHMYTVLIHSNDKGILSCAYNMGQPQGQNLCEIIQPQKYKCTNTVQFALQERSRVVKWQETESQKVDARGWRKGSMEGCYVSFELLVYKIGKFGDCPMRTYSSLLSCRSSRRGKWEILCILSFTTMCKEDWKTSGINYENVRLKTVMRSKDFASLLCKGVGAFLVFSCVALSELY